MSTLATPELSSQYSESSTPAFEGRTGRLRGWVWPALCCVAVLACILLSNPFNEAGFVDDWAYSHVAMKLWQTGTMQYNGWGSPMLLFQSFWALPWIKAFGFSVPVLQVSMIPISLGFVLLVYATGRQINLSRELSGFAALATGASPLFLPSAASFMTESCGCFFSMLCMYLTLRAVKVPRAGAAGSATAVRLLWAITLAGLIGGANRQIVWAAPIMLIPYLTWMRWSDSSFKRHAIAAYGICGIGILTLVHFFGQPYAPIQMNSHEIQTLLPHALGGVARMIASLTLVSVLAAMPAYCCFLPAIRQKGLVWLFVALIALGVFTMGAILAVGLGAPFGNNFLTIVGVTSAGQDGIRVRPEMLPLWFRVVLTGLVNLCVFGSVMWLTRFRSKPRNTEQLTALSIFGVFTVGYFALILPGTLLGFAFDRYMLPVIPLLILTLLLQFGEYKRRIPTAAWCCMALFAFYGVATTHDYFARMRTRLALARRMESRGIPRDNISAGFEYDGWTLVQRSGYLRGVQYQDRFVDDAPKGFWLEFWDHAPNFRPDYVVLNWDTSDPVPADELQASFRAWMPPFHRSVVVWERKRLTSVLQLAEIAGMR